MTRCHKRGGVKKRLAILNDILVQYQDAPATGDGLLRVDGIHTDSEYEKLLAAHNLGYKINSYGLILSAPEQTSPARDDPLQPWAHKLRKLRVSQVAAPPAGYWVARDPRLIGRAIAWIRTLPTPRQPGNLQ